MRPILLLALTVFIDLLGFGIVLPNLPQYIEQCVGHNHPQAAAIGTMLAASYSLMQFVFAPMWGRYSDRVGRRPVILISLLGVSLSYVLFGISNGHLWMLFAARILAGLLSSASIGVSFAYIADITPPEKRAGRIGMLGACIGMGFVFGPFLGGNLGVINLSLPAFVAAGLAIVNFVFTWKALPESLTAEERERLLSVSSSYSPIQLMNKVISGPAGFLFLLTFIATFGFAAMEQIFSFYLLRVFPNEVTPATQPRITGNILGVAGMISGIVQGGLIRQLMKKHDEATLTRFGLLALFIGFITFPLARTILAMACGPMLFLFVGRAFVTPGLSALISRKANLGQGLTLSTSQSFDSLARTIGPLVAGGLFWSVSPASPYYLSAGIMALALLVTIWKAKDMRLPKMGPNGDPISAGAMEENVEDALIEAR